jgi:hypothetical protein
VAAIESAVLSPTFGLAEIKTEVAAIESAVLSPTFGLAEIKTEIIAIESRLDSPTFGLAEIKTEVAAIESAVLSPTFGLAEIKTEVAAILSAVGLLTSPTFGLAEIKTEVAAIESAVLSPTFGLAEIKTEVAAIESAVFSPTFGLEEIKTEIQQILAIIGGAAAGGNVSSGPFFAVNKYLEVKLLNNCAGFVGPVTVTAYDLSTCPKSTVTISGTPLTTTIFLSPGCSTDIFFFQNAGGQKLDISGLEVEVQITTPGGLPSCVLPYSRTTNTGKNATANEINSCCYVRTA